MSKLTKIIIQVVTEDDEVVLKAEALSFDSAEYDLSKLRRVVIKKKLDNSLLA